MPRSTDQPAPSQAVVDALGAVPSASYVLTSAHDGCRSGSLVRWVQRCSDLPPMVMVAHRKGHPVEPLIRDSRTFALCRLDDRDLLLRRTFETERCHGDDPFISVPARCAPGGSPVLSRAHSYIECELLRHLDIECDYELYVGIVRTAEILRGADEPAGRVVAAAALRRPA
ncbi:MAG TPA: flavin reductase [Phycisphaerales bacterium]|nr:flavin reductase [Phycisphaerales bacterium]HMP36739.1 flavin reductase [Phycisphaerales bacterium]